VIHRLALGLGANLGDPPAQLTLALQSFCSLAEAKVESVSRFYYSPAMLPRDNPAPQPDYCNRVAIITTPKHPETLLALSKRIEVRMGRNPDAPRWSARPLDIDLLDCDGWEYASNRLVLPHPGIASRRFVLEPWIEIEPERNVIFGPLKKLLAELINSPGNQCV